MGHKKPQKALEKWFHPNKVYKSRFIQCEVDKSVFTRKKID